VDGDGFDDVLIGAPHAGTDSSGASYVVFGKAGGFAAALNLSNLDGRNGFKILGANLRDRAGHAVSGAGDVNGDGFDDLLISAHHFSTQGYVVFSHGPTNPGMNISDASIIEPHSGTAMLAFTATLHFPSTESISVQYSTADGSATAPADYTAVSAATLTFAPGETTKTILIPIHANSPREPDETFSLQLSNAINATLVDAQAVGTIFDKTAPIQLPTLNGSNGFKINGVAEGDQSGYSVRMLAT
jgi:hypothetical protein